MRQLIKKILDIPALKTNKKQIVFLSDDWGSYRMKSKKAQQELKNKGLRIQNRFDQFDSLETNIDLELLLELLKKHKDYLGNHPIITAVTNVANPDFKKIRSSAFRSYHFKTADNCYKETPDSDRVLELIYQGIEENIFFPQSHGREHLQVNWWMEELQNSESPARKYFDNGYFFISKEDCLRNRRDRGLDGAFDIWDANDMSLHIDTVKSSLKIFEKIFKYRAKVFTPPALIYHTNLEQIMIDNGVKWLDIGRFTKMPQVGGSESWQLNYLGRKKPSGLRVLVRNAVFEPNMASDTDGVANCLAQVENAFKSKKPAIISNHRASFAGRIDQNNRAKGLKSLNKLLTEILKRWPNVEFISANKLENR